jgi:hypothetical protein
VRRVPISLALVLACCASVAEKQPALARSESLSGSQAIGWNVDFHLSGGVAGVDRALTVSSNGELSAEDRRQSARVTGKPTAADLDQIAPLIIRITSIPEIPRQDSSCRDCLSYNLDIEIGLERFTARLDDTSLPGSGLEELARALTTLLNRLLPPK